MNYPPPATNRKSAILRWLPTRPIGVYLGHETAVNKLLDFGAKTCCDISTNDLGRASQIGGELTQCRCRLDREAHM